MKFVVIILARLPFAFPLDDRRSTFAARLALLHIGADTFGFGFVFVTI